MIYGSSHSSYYPTIIPSLKPFACMFVLKWFYHIFWAVFPLFHFVFQLFCRIACVILWESQSPCFSYAMKIKHTCCWLRAFIPSFTCWNGILTVPFSTFPKHIVVLWACMWRGYGYCGNSRDLFHVSLLITDQDVSRCYSTMDGRHTPQSRRPTPDREVQHWTDSQHQYAFQY